MMNKPIIPIQREKVISYENVNQNELWVLGDRQKECKDPIEALIKVLEKSKNTVFCIQTPKLTHGILIQTLQKAATQGVRVYLLVNEYTAELQTLHTKVLIRTGVKLKNSFALENPKSDKASGYFLTGSLLQNYKAEETFSIELKPGQVAGLFTHFCYYFWQEATHELLEKNTLTPIQERGIDIAYNPNDYQGKDFVLDHLFDYKNIIKRKELAGAAILYLGKEENVVFIDKNDTIDLGNHETDSLPPFKDFESQEPVLEEHKTALKVYYHWVNVPFYLPKGAEKHSLYVQWRQQEDNIRKKVKDSLEAEEKNLDTCKRNIAAHDNLKRLLLTKNKNFEDNKEKIDKLLERPLHIEDNVVSIVEDINNIFVKIASDIHELEQNIKKEKLSIDIDVIKKEIKEKIEEKEKIEHKKELEEKEKNETETDGKSKANEKKNKQKEIERQLSDITKRIKYLEKEIENKQKEINSLSVVLQESQGSSLNLVIEGGKNGKDTKNNKPIISVPKIRKLPRPEYGELWSSSGKNYFAITDWDHYDYARDYANTQKDLKIIICTK